ncbi:queuosine precursor transporter [Leisingera sp. HS039]|uniref:queuosine precursor transporter n=1 Tax=unclassified Leisingera TaxID=2614906 RepID=UPI001B3A1243|nr:MULTISPECIES: queuosine precursor transporter [unclassified Leisingera]MBQ4823992.1 queuosine precursor transporter [Leisingera sp. HS039]MCF6431115.1 queuosine precursor transporter [Leisingera sp. MMG026]
MTRSHIPGIAAMAAVVVASNILVQFLFGQWLTWGAFTYPIAFLVTDVMNRVYGTAAARKVVLAGFLAGVICSLIGTQIMLQGDGFTYPAVTLRIALGSGLAFLTAQLLDVAVFSALRTGKWWRAPLASTLAGSSVDTAIFFTIAFSGALVWLEPGNDVAWAAEVLPLLGSGPMAPLWVSLAAADWLVKLSLALAALVPFRIIVRKLTAKTT